LPEITFALRITIPEHVHAGVLREIDEDAEPHDRTQADAIARWLGGLLSEAESTIAAKLPDDFGVVIGRHVHASPSLDVARHVYRERRERGLVE